MKDDIKVFSDPRFSHIVYDPKQREYYNTRSDIFLNDDDISYFKLRPYTLITSPLPKPLPPDYFTNFSAIDALKEAYDNHEQDPFNNESLQDPNFTKSLQQRKPK